MTAPMPALPSATAAALAAKRKRVLLVDGSTATRELRADALRKLGMHVDCATDISEARSWWRADLYRLVLVNPANDLSDRDNFCDEIRAASPPQKLAFLVGKPGFLANSTDQPEVSPAQPADMAREAQSSNAGANAAGSPRRWGIMEAARRISAVRSVAAARSLAMRNRPTPPRDLEARDSRRQQVMSQLASELRKEELL